MRPASSAPTSPYATPPRSGLHLQSGGSGARSAPTSPHRSPPGSPYSALLVALPPSPHLREVSLLKCAPPEHCIVQLVTALPNLESLDLWGCRVTDRVVEVLSLHCPKLRRLSLAENPMLTDRTLALINPASFPDLAALVLRRCTELTSAAIASLAMTWQAVTDGTGDGDDDDYFKQEMEAEADNGDGGWPVPPPANTATVARKRGIEELDLWGVNVYDHALVAIAASCPHLTKLWLGETAVSDEGLHALAQSCTELQEISLRRCVNGVTDAGIVPLLQANPALTKIDLWGVRRVTDATVAAIAQRRPSPTAAAAGVKSLELAESDITDAALFDLARGCRWLEELSLRRCLNITDAGVAALAQGCPHIKTLDLWECGRVTDAGLEAVAAGLPQLHALEVTELPITARSLVALASHCPKLTHLALRRCGMIDDAALAAFFAALPTELRRKRLRTLDLSYCPRLTPAALALLASNPAQLPHTLELYDCPQVGKQHIARFLASVPENRTRVECHEYKSMTVKELKALCEAFECSTPCPTVYASVVCTVNEIRTSGMWYPACPWPKCHKKVEEYHGGDEGYDGEEEGQQQQHHQKRWYCKTCNRVYAGRFVNRYMASLRIVDHTGDLWLRAFDEAAAPLLGTSAQELSQLKDFDETLFVDKVKEAQLQRHEMRVKVVQETYQGRRSGKPFLLYHLPLADVAAPQAAALAQRIETYLWLDFV